MKKLMTLALLAMMVLSMVSAGGSKETQAAASDGPVTVKVWVSSGSEDDKYKEVLDRIEAETGIVITDEYYPKDELDQKLQVSPLVGDTPELIIADYLMIPSYYSSGLIQPLDEYMPEDLYADFIPSVKGETSYDGQIVSVAQFDAGMALWANKSMLENAGVRIPESWEDAWTKEEFEDALEKLQESGVPYPLYIRQNKPASLYFQYMPFLASFGGSYLDEDTMTDYAIEAGADDVVTQDDVFEVYTSVPAFSEVRRFLEEKGLSFLSAELGMFPSSKITLPEDKLETFQKMLDKLEENDDVQTVWHNVELPEEDEEE